MGVSLSARWPRPPADFLVVGEPWEVSAGFPACQREADGLQRDTPERIPQACAGSSDAGLLFLGRSRARPKTMAYVKQLTQCRAHVTSPSMFLPAVTVLGSQIRRTEPGRVGLWIGS